MTIQLLPVTATAIHPRGVIRAHASKRLPIWVFLLMLATVGLWLSILL